MLKIFSSLSSSSFPINSELERISFTSIYAKSVKNYTNMTMMRTVALLIMDSYNRLSFQIN
jgi:hypothetical protein